MSLLVDPTICPDCRARLDADARCTGCGLHLTGPLATRLWSVMTDADRLVEQLRTVPATVPDPAPVPVAAPLPLPPAPRLAPRPAPRRLPALSVPVVLLSLGALCLLVAALVFVAVTWGNLGLTGRTLVLLGVTGLTGGVATVLTRRGLRGAAETFWAVVAGMLGLDLLAAETAGLAGLDALTWRQNGMLVGGALFVLGALVGTWARRTPVRTLYGVQVVAVGGALVAAASGGWTAENPAVGSTVALLVLAGLAALLLRALPWVATGLGVLAAVSWLELVGVGLTRAAERSDLGPWWHDLRGWPLLVAALVAAAAVHVPRLPDRVRAVPAVLALLPLVVLANAPLTPGASTRDLLLRCATLAALTVVVRLAPVAWSLAAGLIAAVGAVLLGLQLAATPLLPLGTLAPWSHLVAAAVVVAAVLVCPRLLPAELSTTLRGATLLLALATGGTGVAATVLAARPDRWVSVSTLLAATVLVGGASWVLARRESWAVTVSLTGGVLTAYLALTTLYAARPSSLLTALAATVMALALAAAAVRSELDEDEEVVTVLLVGLTALAVTFTTWAWCSYADLPDRTTSLVLAAYAVGLLLGARPLARRTTTRSALELTCLVPALVAAATAPGTSDLTLVLTVLGTALAVHAATLLDRAQVGWGALVVLLVASLLRVDVAAARPELWVLPAAVLLLAAGTWRRRTGAPESETLIGSGLAAVTLALVVLVVDLPVDRVASVEATVLALLVAALFAHVERGALTANAPAAAAIAALLGAVAVWGWADVLDVRAAYASAALAAYAGLVGILAAPGSRRTPSRLALELAAVTVALVAVATAPETADVAMVLTIVGSAVAIVSVTNRDRAFAGWLGAGVLGVATLLRVALDVQAPELYTLPAALLLIAAGTWRLSTDREVDSFTALGSGLTLALLPSLLLALEEPVSLRALLVGGGAVVALAYGVHGRLAAPFVLGAGSVALLAVRHIEPVSEAVPRWVTLGLLGVALLGVGVTWEARLGNLHTARRYLIALR